jgi:hypothetical protein
MPTMTKRKKGGLDFKGLPAREVLYVAKALQLLEQQKHDPSAGAPALSLGDTGGIFSYPYGRPEVINAIKMPNTFLGELPMRKSNIRNDIVEVLTSLSAATGTNPDSTCGVPMSTGDLAVCRVKTQFGKMFMKTQKIAVTTVGLRDSWAVKEKPVVNAATFANPWVPDRLANARVDLSRPGAAALWKAGVAALQAAAQIEVVGDITLLPAATHPFWIREFQGLDNLIAPVTDADTGDPCPAASPEVYTWNAAVDAEVATNTLVNLMHMLYYSRVQLAQDTGFGEVQFAWVMDRRLFYHLVQVYACTYAFARCGDFDAGQPGTRMLSEIETRRNQMFNGRYLLMDGTAVPVLFTSGTEVDVTLTPTLNSSIYLIPLRDGSRPLTYVEYNPFDSDLVQEAIRDYGMDPQRVRSSNNGLYLFSNRDDGYCVELLLTMQPRLMMDARFLAARIDDIDFTSYVGNRDWIIGAPDYEGGGETAYASGLGT